MRFPLAIISVFVLLVLIIDVSYVNAKNVPTTTDGENHLKTTSNHNTDQTTDEKTTSKNDQTNKPCHNKHAPCMFTPSAFIKDSELPKTLRRCRNGYYYTEKFGCVKIP